MTLRDSLDLIKAVNRSVGNSPSPTGKAVSTFAGNAPESGHAVLEHEIMGERASSLNAAEQQVAKSMDALRAADPDNKTDELAQARKAVWAYFVQRELIGFKRHQDVIAAFGITREVLNGLGVTDRKPTPPSSSAG